MASHSHNGTWDGVYNGNWINGTWCNKTNPYEPDYCWDDDRSDDYSTGTIVGLFFGTLVMALLMSFFMLWCIGRLVTVGHDDEAPSWWFDDVRASQVLDYRGANGEGDPEGIKLKEGDIVKGEKVVIELKDLVNEKSANEPTSIKGLTVASESSIHWKPIIANNPTNDDESKNSDGPKTSDDTKDCQRLQGHL